MSKQDIPAMRSVMDVERKYGKTFAETMGLAADAKESADDATERAEKIDKSFTEEQGIYHKDGKWYINAEIAKILMLSCDLLNGGVIKGQVIENGNGTFSVSADGTMVAKDATIIGILTCSEGSEVGGFKTDGNSLFSGEWKKSKNISPDVFMCTGTTGEYALGGSELIPGWCFGAGKNFGVTKDGMLYCVGGKIGGWYIQDGYLSNSPLADMGGTVRLYPDRVTYVEADDIKYSATWEEIIKVANPEQLEEHQAG